MRSRALGLTLAALLASAAIGGASDQATAAPATAPDEDRLLNREVPDVALTTSDGRRVRLSAVAGGRPLVVALVFTRCAGVCSPLVMSWRKADRSIAAPAAYHRLVVSFDPRDTVDDMATLARHLDLTSSSDWTFAVAEPAEIRTLADAIGFWYEWDERLQQFDHPAMLAGIRDGRLVRLLVGGTVSPARLDELVRQLSGRFVASYPLPGRVRFRCVQFDGSGRVALDWGFGLLLLPVAATVAATAALFAGGARARRRALVGAGRIVR